MCLSGKGIRLEPHLYIAGASLEPDVFSEALALSHEGICLEPLVLDEGAMHSARRTQFDARRLDCNVGLAFQANFLAFKSNQF